MDRTDLVIRRAEHDDIPAAIKVATAALGWNPSDPNEAFFRWKHTENPAGPSPMWVAVDNDAIAGFRTMMRWNFNAVDGHTLSAVRAVDTATHPDHQRRGIFRSLTMAAVDELTANGTGFVFNTPNDNSRPGYLRMGWRELGRIPTRFSLASPAAMPRLLGARKPADKWSIPTDAGDPIATLTDDLPDLLARLPAPGGIATSRTVDHLTWRYAFEPLHYRCIRDDEAAAIVRVRRRGSAREAVLAEVLSPDLATTRRLLRRIRREFHIDHILTLAAPPHPAPRMATLPRIGPRLTVRDLAETAPTLESLRFALGDIELF